ncbi:response regulator [Methylobacterium oxalidis]|uniref:response regulator n=1 Tax=Methylobacterium oxalidis TaxID=944322 RepID=UPI0033150E57
MGQATPPARTALVVEDDRALRNLAAAVLEETDLRVIEADSGEDALFHLREHANEVALIFADVRLPCILDGVDLVRAVSTRYPWIKLLVTSGDPGDRIEHLPAGATYLQKPWRSIDVLKAAEQAAAAR